jgi:hypothetical protein
VRLLVLGSVLGCLVAGVATAQDKPATSQDRPADNMEVLREKLRADKKVIVASALQLTEGEAKAFWPVYNAYQSDMVTHYDRVQKLLDDYGEAAAAMTDEKATALLRDFLGLETAHLALLKAYVPRFQKVLPGTKVARLYQVENKLRALVNYELARTIPLVK